LAQLQEPYEAARRAKFAKALARDAFGRFFWDEELGRRLDAEIGQSQKSKKERMAKRPEKKR
jgi:hypothetical protein